MTLLFDLAPYAEVVQKNGQWVFPEPGKPAPDGLKPVDMQSITVADVYVSRGAPNAAALAPRKQGLELHPLTHPNSIVAGQEARFEVLLDGRPLPGQKVLVHRADEDLEGAEPLERVTDSAGRFAVKVDRPGVLLALTRYLLARATASPARA